MVQPGIGPQDFAVAKASFEARRLPEISFGRDSRRLERARGLKVSKKHEEMPRNLSKTSENIRDFESFEEFSTFVTWHIF